MADREHIHNVERSRPCDRCGVEGCPLAFTGDGCVCEGCWPDAGLVVLEAGPIDGLRPNQVPTREQVQAHYDARLRADAMLDFEVVVDNLRDAAAAVSDEQLATLPELQRRFVTEVRAHLAEYDRAKQEEG
jgi:hypothetical protein